MSGKASIKINFTDFWSGFDKKNNFFYNLLIEKYQVTISEDPDLLFYSVYSSNHINYSCTKILFTGENQRPDFVLCDFAFSFDYSTNPKNYRLPLYALWADVNSLVNNTLDPKSILNSKTKFCCFIVSNNKCDERNRFFLELSKYKHIDSGGSVFNNIGGLVENKRDYIKEYKFVISFENASYPGYTTEKVYEPLLENCIPIYWGNPRVCEDFNTRRFINCHEYSSFKDVIDHVIEVDNNDDLYMKYLSEPAFKNDEVNELVKKENIEKRLKEIVDFHFDGRFKIYPVLRPAYFYIRCRQKYIELKFKSYKYYLNRLVTIARSSLQLNIL